MESDAAQPWLQYTARQRWSYLAVLFLVSTSNYADRNVISVLLEPIKAEFHVSDTMLGLLSGFAFAALYATLGIPVARLADTGNRRTVITVALVVWSTMTVLCGMAQSFLQLALARFGVGAGEAGAIPPAQSLIADYFAPAQRARALSVFLSSATVGYLLGFVAASQIAVHHGWRAAFLVMGLPGLALAILTRTVLDEPRLRRRVGATGHGDVSVVETFRALSAKRAFVNLALGITCYFLYAYGAAIFFPAYIIRVLGVSMATMGPAFGATSALAALVGTIGGGILTDRLSRRDVRWLVWLPAIGLSLALPVAEAGLVVTDFGQYLALGFVVNICIGATLPAVFAAIHVVCGSARRAMAVATIFFFANLFGLGLGPLMTGALSDGFTSRYGLVGLRYALILATLMLVPAVWFLAQSARTLLADSEA